MAVTYRGLVQELSRGLAGLVLGPSVRRSAIASLFGMATSQNIPLPSGTAILQQLRNYDLGIRSQDFFALWNLNQQYGALAPQQSLLAPDATIQPSLMPTSVFNTRTEYTYGLDIDVIAYGQTEFESKRFWYGSNDLLSADEARDRFFAEFVDSFDPDSVDWDSTAFGIALQRGPLG